MKYVEEYGDLFSLPPYFYLCQCISADFVMGKGIAVEFNRRFNMKNRLRSKYTINGNYPRVILEDKVFNLVTKDKYYNKPTYETMYACLDEMAKIVKEKGIKYLGMPQIGSGLDRLNWNRVAGLIRKAFIENGCDCYIVIKKKRNDSDDDTAGKYGIMMSGRGFI